MLLTSNFRSEEFDVHEPFPTELAQNRLQLARRAQWLRNLAGSPGIITSAFRSPARNTAIGGVDSSQHMKGEAIDIVFQLAPLRTLAARALDSIAAGTAPSFGQIIFYSDKGHIHLSLPMLGPRNGEVRYSFETRRGERLYPMLTTAAALPMYSATQTRGGLWLGVAALVVLLFARSRDGHD